MRDPKLIETCEVLLSEIDTENRLRPVSDTAVESLIASIKQLGHMKDEIHIRRVAHQDNKLKLIAGGHRVAAAIKMGWETIPAKIWDCADDWAVLLEIDDNLAHAELGALELAVFLAERKRVYEKLHPETKKGAAGANARWNATDMMSFAKSTAEKRDLTERHIRRLVSIGDALSKYEISVLYSAEKPVSLKDLQELAKVTEKNLRAEVIGYLSTGRSKSVKEALSELSPKEKPTASDPIEDNFKRLLEEWKRAPMAVKRRFVAVNSEELVELYGQPTEEAA